MHCVSLKTFDINNLIVSPINEKSFKVNSMYYGNIKYKYSNEEINDLYLMIRDVKLTRNLIDAFKPAKEGGYHTEKYCSERYKAIISLKELPEIGEVLSKIDDKIKPFGAQIENNSLLADLDEDAKLTYYPMHKKPNNNSVKIYKEHNEKSSNMTNDEIKKIIGPKMKLTLKRKGSYKDGKYQIETGENTEILCNIRTVNGITLEPGKKTLDYFEKTFVNGTVIDMVIKIPSWYFNASKSDYGVKSFLTDITVKNIIKKQQFTNLLDENGNDIFGDCSLIKDDEENEENETKTTETEKKFEDMEDNDDSFNEESPKPIKQIKRKIKKISDIENDNDF